MHSMTKSLHVVINMEIIFILMLSKMVQIFHTQVLEHSLLLFKINKICVVPGAQSAFN